MKDSKFWQKAFLAAITGVSSRVVVEFEDVVSIAVAIADSAESELEAREDRRIVRDGERQREAFRAEFSKEKAG
jgi:hypothetical protein